ncbi:MAG TPA: biosynthetic peptidoglycan transglycosylase [Bacteroidia bacterium]|nr:biosynthetic peptidoglycan transglycosylase [Bacteroidia bacterium]
MTQRTRTLLFAATLTLVVGVCGAWPLLRTGMLQGRLQRACASLHRLGLSTRAAADTWDGTWTARVDSLVAYEAGSPVLRFTDIVFHLRPAFSLHGSEWVQSITVGEMIAQQNGWQARGKGWIIPSTLAGVWKGELRKGDFSECQLAAAAQLNLVSAGQVWHQGKRRLGLAFEFADLQLQHASLSNHRLQFGELAGWVKVEAGQGRLALRPGSCLRWGAAQAWVSGHWDARAHAFAGAAHLPSQPVQALLSPIAALTPAWLAGLRADGSVSGSCVVSGDLDALESLQIKGNFDGNGIAVRQYGPARLDSLSEAASGRNLVPLTELPPYLVQAVLLSEDAGFWEHEGFDLGIIRLAIIENLQEGRFVRGAGTIPMQLTRNIFLHHGKQADRKLAEVMLTWLAQEQHILTKEEELVLYLNLIEWGWDDEGKITGIRAASRHYFRKSPSQLTPNESIFLACVIPNPKHAASLLEADGSLGPYAQAYFDTMRWMLYEGDWIDEESLDADYPVFQGIGGGSHEHHPSKTGPALASGIH